MLLKLYTQTTYITQAVNVTYDATYADPSLDSFAQTAGTDDLFFDDEHLAFRKSGWKRLEGGRAREDWMS